MFKAHSVACSVNSWLVRCLLSLQGSYVNVAMLYHIFSVLCWCSGAQLILAVWLTMSWSKLKISAIILFKKKCKSCILPCSTLFSQRWHLLIYQITKWCFTSNRAKVNRGDTVWWHVCHIMSAWLAMSHFIAAMWNLPFHAEWSFSFGRK